MEIEELDPDLIAHLRAEFGDTGHQAAGFLQTALDLLSSNWETPRKHEAVAYCLREALLRILAKFGLQDGQEWRHLSRAVVNASETYKDAILVSGEGGQSALNALLRSVDDMKRFHDEASSRQNQVIRAIANRTGSRISEQSDAVRRHQQLLDRLNEGLHRQCCAADSLELWADTIAILRQLFLPPDKRHIELDKLAQLESPDNAAVEKVRGLLVTSNHLRYFMSRVVSFAWLELLGSELSPPEPGTPWAGFSAVGKLGSSHPEEVTGWLGRLYRDCKSEPGKAWYVVRAALDLGGTAAIALVLEAVSTHPHDRALLLLGLWAVESVEPTEESVEHFADVMFNESSWAQLPYRDPVPERFVAGTNAENAQRRIRLLCFKLRAVSEDDPTIDRLALFPNGSFDDYGFYRGQDDRVAAILGCLVSVLRQAREAVPVAGMLGLIEELHESLRSRLRSWILAKDSTVDESLMVDEIERSITRREPTGDDILLLDRIAEVCKSSDHLVQWSAAFGDPPSVEDVTTAIGVHQVLVEWRRAFAWLSVLPEGVAEDWSRVCDVLADTYGRLDRSALERRSPMRVGSGRSPFSGEELSSRDPGDAARLICDWRPGPEDLGGFWELARTLGAVVACDPAGWTSDPISIATELRHPIYIAHYVGALASLAADVEVSVDKMLDLVHLVTAHPWQAELLGRNDFDRDDGWRGVDRAAVDLIKALADADVDFGSRSDEVWTLLKIQVLRRDESSGFSADHERDALTRAINRPCTLALEAVLSFMAYEFRRDGSVRSEAIHTIESTLRLDGVDGEEHRAVLARRFPLLRHLLPEWVDANQSLLFGDEAPDGLGQPTVDQAIKWGHWNSWLLDNVREQIGDAVVREVDRALDHYLVGMLWECDGYRVTQVVDFLRSEGLISEAAETLGRLLRREDEPWNNINIAVEFWRECIDKNPGMSLYGFGLFSEIVGLDDETWVERTLATLRASGGRIKWAPLVAKRLVAAPPTKMGLEIMNLLVRNPINELERLGVSERASDYLSAAQGLTGTDEYQRLRTALLERGIGDS